MYNDIKLIIITSIVEDYIENKKFPEKMRIFHEYPIRSETGEIFTEPGMILYTVELRREDKVLHEEVFMFQYIFYT